MAGPRSATSLIAVVEARDERPGDRSKDGLRQRMGPVYWPSCELYGDAMPYPRSRIRNLVLFLGLTLVGCASVPDPADWRTGLMPELRQRGLDPEAILAPLALDGDMEAFAAAAVEGVFDEPERVRALLRRLTDPDHLDLTYAWGYTGTTEEVFERRQANCLAFTNLFVSMARSVGLPVHYLLVRDNESFRKEGDLVVISDHVAVGYGTGPQRLVIDLSAEGAADSRKIVAISDLTALALYQSNRGAETLQEGDPETALRWLTTSLTLDAGQASTWVNFGVALRRAGRPDDAELAYRQALEIDPASTSALNNLASLLRMAQRDEEARELEETLARTPGRNPYTFLALGDLSMRNGRLDEAERLYRRAITLDRQSADGYAALGQLAMATGNRAVARRLLRKARKQDAENPRAVRLAQALGEGEDGSG